MAALSGASSTLAVLICDSGVAPHLARRLYDELELAPLIVHRQQVAGSHRREAALWAECEMLERNVSRRLVDARAQVVVVLEARLFRRHQAQHHVLAARNQTQRLKAPGAIGVVFEQE